MNLWKCKNWVNIIDADRARPGVRLRFDKGIDDEVRRSCKEFMNWIRKQYYFPIRVPIYIKSSNNIKALDGDMVSATFFEPYDYNVEPYIRIAVGDYYINNTNGKDDALAGILHSIAHELSHYYQWINGIQLTESGYERQATFYSRIILDEYSETREHP